MPAAELRADSLGGKSRDLAHDVHRYLAVFRSLCVLLLRAQILGICAVGARDLGYYLVHNDGNRLVVAENIPYRLLSGGGVDMRALYLDISLHLLDRALKLADVVLELLRYVFNDIVADIEVKRVRLALDYEHTGLEIRRLNVREQPPLKACAHSVLKLRHIFRRAVG